MSLGIFMKGFNAAYFRKPLDFIFEFIPQIILILALFGWMDILIIAKWLNPKYVDKDFDYHAGASQDQLDGFNQTNKSPPIITTMIDMFLAGASNELPDKFND